MKKKKGGGSEKETRSLTPEGTTSSNETLPSENERKNLTRSKTTEEKGDNNIIQALSSSDGTSPSSERKKKFSSKIEKLDSHDKLEKRSSGTLDKKERKKTPTKLIVGGSEAGDSTCTSSIRLSDGMVQNEKREKRLSGPGLTSSERRKDNNDKNKVNNNK